MLLQSLILLWQVIIHIRKIWGIQIVKYLQAEYKIQNKKVELITKGTGQQEYMWMMTLKSIMKNHSFWSYFAIDLSIIVYQNLERK